VKHRSQKTDKPSLDEARLLSRFRKKQLDAEQAEKVRKAVQESRNDEELQPRQHELTKPGDPRQLRGIPCLAQGVGGAIAGSLPHAADFG
jgi:hypothetical protein